MADTNTSAELSTLRTSLMRLVFLGNFLYVGFFATRGLVTHAGPWESGSSVAHSFWAALALLSALGIRHPVRMTPVLLMQLVYKLIWLLAIYLPASPNTPMPLAPVMISGAIVDLLVIPWPYVWAAYFTAPPDAWPWRRGPGPIQRLRSLAIPR
jgi:hypothetical protein